MIKTFNGKEQDRGEMVDYRGLGASPSGGNHYALTNRADPACVERASAR